MAENTENTQPTSPVINMDEALKSINSAPTYQSNSGTLFPNSSVPTYSSNNIAELTTSKFTPMPLSQAYRDIGGNALTGPNNNVTGSSIADYLNNGSFAYDPKFAGVTDIYGASNAGLRFAKAYNHSAFDRLGFSPYVNNTDRYLGYATGWEDFKTAIAPNRLFTAGMVDQASNWFEWNKPTDPAAARLMTNTMSLYQTERTGFWGGAANTMASLQYSMGAITEFALEEGALIGLTAATGGAAGEGGFLRTIRNVGALGRSLSVGAELLNTIKTVDRAKDFWQAAKFAGVGAAKTANALINPLYRTTSNAYDTYKGVKAGKTTAEIAKNKAYFGDFFRDLSEINMSLSEARLEGGMVQNDIYDGILKSNPNLTSDQAKRAYELAVKGGSETTMWNAMAIYMTNKFVFDSLLGRMMPKSSRLLKMGESLGGKYVMDQGKHVFLEDGFGKNLRRAILPFSKEGKLYYKHFLQTAPTRMSTFALGSSMEGLQENVQEALNITYTDYYTKLYNTPELAQSQGLRASISKGIHEQFTTQGLQTFLSGFAIGGGLGAYGKALNWSLYQAPMIVADKTGISKEYSTAKEARAKFRDEVNSVVADMDSDPISYFNAIENDLAHQVNFYDYVFAAQNAGDNQQVKTNQDAQLLKRIHTLFRSGQVDLLRDTFKEYRNMSDQDLQEAFQGYKLEGDENNKPLRDRLDETLNKIDVMEKSFKEAQKIENPYNPFKFDKTKEPDKYNEEAYKYLAVEEVKFDMAFLKTTLVLAQQYTADILEKAGKNKPLANMPGVQFTSIITKNGLKTEIDMLKKERIAYEQTAATSDKAQAELGRIDKKLDLYEKFLSGYELYQDTKRNAPADIIRNKSQKKQDGETEQTINPVTESIENHADNLKNAFFDVIKELASETGDNPLSENIDDVFESLREMIDHDVDFSSSIDALNMLYDPAGFEAHHGRIKQALENVHKMHKENNSKIFDELQHKKDLNAFLNNLMAKGIFYDPKYAAAFEDDSVLPESFIDSTTMEELDHTSPKYKDLLNEIDNFERSTGKTLSGKLIPEFDPLSISTRVQRAPGDVRTMAVLSRQFGVSQDTTEDSVSVEEVLDALMKSPQALPTEKVLAKRLLPLVSKAAKINFVRNLSQPVSYSESTGIMVDLRYASIDYSGGILKAEPIVLSGILKSIVTNALETNNNFKQKAQNLLNIAKQNILDKNNNYSQLPIGLDSVENFIAEALTNINFQASLRNIEYTGERASKTSLWQEFKKALEDLFTKIFKLAPKTKQTLLDEAIDLTALTIDANANMVGSSPATGGSTPSNNPAGVPVTQGMPFEEIMAIPQYAEALRKVFAAFPQLGTDEDAFKQFVLTNPSAKGVIDNLNVQTGRTNANAQAPGESQSGASNNNVAPGQEVISDDDLRLFRENNTVSDDILNDIKTRREQGQDLTPRQHEIMKSPYGEIIEKAISLQIDQIDQDKQVEIQIMAEAEKLTMPDIYGPMEEYPFGADKAFNLIYGGKLHIVKDEKGNYTAILFQNLTQEQVLAGEGIKTFAVSTILQRPEPGYKPLQDLLRPLQAKIDEIVAKNTKPATQPGTPAQTDTDPRVADIERRKEISYSLEPGSQSSYERNKFTFTYVRPFDYNELDNIRPVGQNAYIVNNYGEQKTFDSYAEGQKWLDSKYNAELATPTTTTKTEPEKTEEQQVDDDINTNPETRDEVNEGMSGIDNATTEVENDIAEIERKVNEGKTAPLTERAKETINQIKEATAKLKESMKSSYAKMGPEMTNAYEKLRRAHKQTAGKVREKLKVLLDKILKFLRKLGDIVKTSFNKVFSKRTTEGFVIQPGAPTVTVTGLETKDNTLEQVSDFISNLLNNYGFTAFFKQSGFAITPDLIKSLDTKGSKLGDSQILGYASAMETALHKLLHLYIDTKVSGKEMSRFDAKAKVRIETIKTLIGQKIAEGKPYQSTLDKLNYIVDKNPAHQIAAYFMTNREFRSLVSGLSKDSYRALEILSKDMTDFTDAKVRKFITLQDGLNMADEEYDEFEKNSVPSPMTILSEAIENTGGEGTVANLANQLATPIEEIIATETTEEELQEIAKSEGKSVTEIVTDIKNAVTRYLSSTTLGRTKTSLDQAPKTKKESVIRRIIRKLRNILMAMSISFGMYTGVAGFDMSTSSTAEEDVAKPAWSIANAIDNTMYWLPISESYKQTIMRGFIKYGIYDISNVKEAVIEDVAEAQAIKESEDRLEYIRQNTYFQDFGKEGTVRDDRGGSTDSLFMYRNQWFNDVGFEYLATPSNSTRDRVGQMTYNNTVAVAHFYIMDDTGGDLSRYTSAEKLQEARDVFKKRIGTYDVKLTDYVPVFKFMPRNEQGENIVKLQYKIASELTNDDIAITKLLQWKFSDIDWDSKVGLYDASYCLTTKSGAKAPSFTFSRNPKGRDSYSRFSGSTIVFIFNDQKGNTIVREFTGPLNAIKAEAESIMQTFNVEPEDLTLGAFDAGSYSGKPKAKSNVLDTNQWDGFNKIHPNAGSALVIPIASTTKMIQLSDISAPQSEINNVINEKTKACK
jgi:hypothetical protein